MLLSLLMFLKIIDYANKIHNGCFKLKIGSCDTGDALSHDLCKHLPQRNYLIWLLQQLAWLELASDWVHVCNIFVNTSFE